MLHLADAASRHSRLPSATVSASPSPAPCATPTPAPGGFTHATFNVRVPPSAVSQGLVHLSYVSERRDIPLAGYLVILGLDRDGVGQECELAQHGVVVGDVLMSVCGVCIRHKPFSEVQSMLVAAATEAASSSAPDAAGLDMVLIRRVPSPPLFVTPTILPPITQRASAPAPTAAVFDVLVCWKDDVQDSLPSPCPASRVVLSVGMLVFATQLRRSDGRKEHVAKVLKVSAENNTALVGWSSQGFGKAGAKWLPMSSDYVEIMPEQRSRRGRASDNWA